MSNVINIAVCDDDETMLPVITGVVRATFEGHEARIDTFGSADALYAGMDAAKGYDLIFLDIDVPGTDGIQFGVKLRGEKRNTDIIYVSEREDRVFESFKVHPFGFVRKRNFLKDISSVVKMWLDGRSAVPADKIVIEGTGGSFAVALSEIVYIESMKKLQYVHIKGGKEPFEAASSLEKFAERFARYGFLQPHKSYLVNYLYIRYIGKTELVLTTGENIPVSRRRAEELKGEYMKLMQDSTPAALPRQTN